MGRHLGLGHAAQQRRLLGHRPTLRLGGTGRFVAQLDGVVTEDLRLAAQRLRSGGRLLLALADEPLGLLLSLRADLGRRVTRRGDDAGCLLAQHRRDAALVELVGLVESLLELGQALTHPGVALFPGAQCVSGSSERRTHLGRLEPFACPGELAGGERGRVELGRCGQRVGHGRNATGARPDCG